MDFIKKNDIFPPFLHLRPVKYARVFYTWQGFSGWWDICQ